MKIKILFILILFISLNNFARNPGETEITTEEGIEVYQKDKYYLLKKNVEIVSDDFTLKANMVKVFFNKDLYDIEKIESNGNVVLTSLKGIQASGEKINFDLKKENIIIVGKNFLLINNEIKMTSDNLIDVNNSNGKFIVKGKNSSLTSNNINIIGSLIEGKFLKTNNINEVEKLYVSDDNNINIKTNKLDMFAKKADYDKNNNIIELFDDVKIYRDKEIITGNYAKINTLEESYKVTSDSSNKVKVLLNNAE